MIAVASSTGIFGARSCYEEKSACARILVLATASNGVSWDVRCRTQTFPALFGRSGVTTKRSRNSRGPHPGAGSGFEGQSGHFAATNPRLGTQLKDPHAGARGGPRRKVGIPPPPIYGTAQAQICSCNPCTAHIRDGRLTTRRPSVIAAMRVDGYGHEGPPTISSLFWSRKGAIVQRGPAQNRYITRMRALKALLM
jgi:hypothetical protein